MAVESTHTRVIVFEMSLRLLGVLLLQVYFCGGLYIENVSTRLLLNSYQNVSLRSDGDRFTKHRRPSELPREWLTGSGHGMCV